MEGDLSISGDQDAALKASVVNEASCKHSQGATFVQVSLLYLRAFGSTGSLARHGHNDQQHGRRTLYQRQLGSCTCGPRRLLANPLVFCSWC